MDNQKEKILVCGILPPPNFGHSTTYKTLLNSPFADAFEIIFLDLRFWSYQQHKKITILKILKFFKYYAQYIWLILSKRPRYVLYSISFDKMPLLKDYIFCVTGKILGRRIVLHDMGQYLKASYDSSNKFFQSVLRSLLKNVAGSIVLGECTRGIYEGFISPDRVINVHGGVEDSQRYPTPSRQKNSNGVHRVLFFSFMSASKGVMTALNAAHQVIQKRDNIHFVFGGPMESPERAAEIDHFIKDHGLQESIDIAGYIEDPVKRTRMLREADVFIFPTHRDVFGLVILHALAEGVPVIASREGAIGEIIKDEINGFLIPKGDYHKLAEKIIALIDHPDLRVKILEENRKRYLDFYTPEKYAQRMINAFEMIEKMENK